MSSQNTKKSMAKIVAAMLVGTVGTGFYGVDAAGLAGSYVGIGTAPTEDRVVKSGTEYKDSDIVGSKYLVDYRQTTNAQGNTFERIPANDNKNGEGVDGTSTANDSRNGVGTTAIGLGTYAARDYATAVGTYTSAISGSTSVGSGAYASQYSAAFGRNTYANSKGVAVGDGARAANGLAIGTGATAGEFYKYIQSDGTQNYGAIINSIAIGPNASAVGGTAIGAKAQTNSLYGVALGQNSKVSYNGVALGVNAQVTAKGNGGIALGTSSVANRGAGTIGYMPLVDGVKGEVAANDSRLAEVMGLSDDIKNFTTQYATEISEYNQLNKNYSEIDAKKEEQKNIMIATKGNDDAAYQAAKTEYDKLSKDAVAATNARNAWTAAHQEFTQAMAEQQSALAVFKATDGAVSVGSDAYVDAKTGKTIKNTRQIINVAAGTEDTDAVNVAQLKAVANVVDDKMSDFTVGADKAAQKDGITVDATDENKRFDIVGADDNITTNVDGRTITVGLGNNLNLTNAGSVQFGSATTDTKLDTTGLTVNNTTNPGIDLKFTSSGISAGNQVVENVKSDIADEAGDTYLTKLSTANGNNPNSAVNVSDLQSTASALDTKITKAGDDITTINTNIGKLQAGFNVAAGTNTSSVALGGDTAPTITFAGDANVTAALDKATNTVTYILNKDGITTTLGDTFTKIDASNLQGDTTNINKWKTVLGVTDDQLKVASAWKLQANTDAANASTIAKDDTVIFANGTGTEVKKAGNTITVGLDDATNTKINNITNIGGDVTKLQAGFNVAAGNNTSAVALGGDTAPTITFAGDANVTAALDKATNTVTYTLNKDGITTTLGDTFTKIDASNLQGDTTNINKWKTVLGVTDDQLKAASAWKLQANTDAANASTIAKDDTVIFANGTGTEVKKTDNTITVGLDDATNTKINNITNIGGDVTKLQAGFNVAAGNNTSAIALGGDTAPTITFAGDANVTAALDKATNTVTYTLNKDGITTTLGDTFAKVDASNLQGDTTNIDKWKTVLGVTDTALGQASAWKLQVNGKDESTISKDSVVNFVNGTGIDITKANNDITVGLDKTTQDKIDNASGDVTKLQAGFNVAVGTNTSSVALGGDTAPTITFAGDENVKPELSGTTVTYKLDKTGIITTLGDTFTKVDASNLQGDTTNINNWKTVLGITDTALGQASAWKLQANGENESIISKDSVVNFVNGTSTEVTKNDNTITVDLNEATKNQISNNTKAIGDIKNDVTKINNKIDNIVTNDGNLNIQGDDATGVVVGAADANDPKKGLKVSLGDTIKVGDITLSGKDGNSTLTGLSNTTWDESNFQADRAATEGQLKDFMGKINDNVTPTKFKDDDNIHVKEISKNNFEISLDENLKVENSISVGGDTYISKEGINANDKVITNVGESKLEAGSKNAATVNQVVEVRDELNETIGNVAGAVQDNMRQMAKLDDRMNKVGAGAAALAGLHPLEFNPDDKFSAAVAMGSYKGQGAAALGGFYRPNADTMFSVSSTLGDETMFNIGVSLKFGQKGDDVYRNPNNTSFRDLTNEVASLKEENKALNDKMTEKEKSFEATNKALNDKVTAQQVELEQQRALIQQLMAKVGM